MTFHDIRFPLPLSLGARGGPERRTEIVALVSGHEERNSPWAHSRRRYNAGTGLKTLDDLEELVAFFEARHGRLHAFRWRDGADWKSCAPSETPSETDQSLGTGDGAQDRFQIVKHYASGGQTYTREITKPVSGSLRIAVDGAAREEGTHFVVDHGRGEVTFLAGHIPPPGAAVTAGFEFDVPVRFDTDYLEINLAAFEAGAVPDIPLIEVRLP